MQTRGADATWLPSEAALAHNLGDQTQKAYIQDTDLLEARRLLMEEWAKLLSAATARTT